MDTKRDLEGLKLDSTFYYCIAFEKLTCFNNQDKPVRDFLINQILNSSRVSPTIVRRKSLRFKQRIHLCMHVCMYLFEYIKEIFVDITHNLAILAAKVEPQ